MNSLLYYYNNVQKMAAYRQAKRMQRGVKFGFEQNISLSSTTKFVSTPIPIGTSDFSLEFYGNTYGSYRNTNPSIFNQSQPYTYGKGFFSIYQVKQSVGGIEWIIFEKPATGWDLDDSINIDYEPEDPLEKFYFVITRQGTTVKVYINGKLKATKEQSEVKDLGDLQLAIANSSDVGFVRVWNYALSADDVTAHYNNGDPMGYVVPKSARRFEVSYNSDFSTGVDGWKGSGGSSDLTVQSNNGVLELSGNYSTYQISRAGDLKPKYASAYKVRIEFEEPITVYRIRFYPFSAQATADVYPSGPITVFEAISSIECENLSASCYLYMYGLTPNTVVRIKSISAYPVGLLAEYLPQNLMYGRDDKTIATYWLDSAKQLPLSNEYMEPLFQSIGCYDMAANGAPEILYNE